MKPTPVSALARRRVRQHVKRDDTPKKSFIDKPAADDFLLASGFIAHGYVSYQCDICRRWHVGHEQNEEEK